MTQLAITEEKPLVRERDPCGDAPIVRDFKDTGNSIVEPVYDLLRILSWKRPFDSRAEEQFAQEWVDPAQPKVDLKIAAAHEIDKFRNRHIAIPNPDGTPSRILWSCHIDTCHNDEGYQRLAIHKDAKSGLFFAQVRKGEGNCLGADDGTGVWLMLQMIAAGKPGYYLFHRGEERGCLGSRWLVDNEKDRFIDKIDAAIALDRRDFDNIITHQGGERGCSDAFARHIGSYLSEYKPDPTGAFTDTKQYFRIIPECTNLSVGYQSQHGPLERQYLTFARELRDQLLTLPISTAPVVRDPAKIEHRTYSYEYGGRGHNYTFASQRWSKAEQKLIDDKDAIWCNDKRSWVTRPAIANADAPTSTLSGTPPNNGYNALAQTNLIRYRHQQIKNDLAKPLNTLILLRPTATADLLSRLYKSIDHARIAILEEYYGDDLLEYLIETNDARMWLDDNDAPDIDTTPIPNLRADSSDTE